MPTATSPNTNPTTAPTSHPPLPPPQTFDFLPPLHTLLSRMLLPTNNGDISSPAPSPQTNNNNNTTSPLSPKDLATAASGITAKIQKARNAVKELPGIEMSNEELEEMIGELEAEVERLNGVEANIKKAVGDSLKMLEKGKKKDGEGEREGQEEEAMEEGFEQGHHQSDKLRRFEHRHESDASSAATLVGDGSPGGAAGLREMAVRQMEDLSLDTHGG